LAEEFDLAYIGSGDVLREAIASDTELGKEVKDYLERGALVPDEIVIKIIEGRLQKPDCKKGVVFDGFPRTLAQAEKLDEIIEIDKVFNLKVSDQTVIERLSGRRICEKCAAIYHVKNNPPKQPGFCDRCDGKLYQREDDKEDVIKKRLRVYEERTEPLIKYYESKITLIDANKGIDDIFEEICNSL
jgi:adenylate kinase